MEIGKKIHFQSRQACFVIAHSSGDFNDKNIHNHRLYTSKLHCRGKFKFKCLVVTQQRFISVAARRYKFVTLLSDDRSGRQIIKRACVLTQINPQITLLTTNHATADKRKLRTEIISSKSMEKNEDP